MRNGVQRFNHPHLEQACGDTGKESPEAHGIAFNAMLKPKVEAQNVAHAKTLQTILAARVSPWNCEFQNLVIC